MRILIALKTNQSSNAVAIAAGIRLLRNAVVRAISECDAMEGDGCEPALAVCPAPPRNRAPEASNIPEALAGRFICEASLSDREQQLTLNQMVAATLFDRCCLFDQRGGERCGCAGRYNDVFPPT
jgi:hypothetical protein